MPNSDCIIVVLLQGTVVGPLLHMTVLFQLVQFASYVAAVTSFLCCIVRFFLSSTNCNVHARYDKLGLVSTWSVMDLSSLKTLKELKLHVCKLIARVKG